MNVMLSLVLAVMLAISQTQQLHAQVGQTKQDSSVAIKDLRAAPTTVVLNNKSLHLWTFPWRDFMPVSGSAGGSPLMVALKIKTADQQPFPSGIRIDRAWVLFGEEVWEISNLRERRPGQAPEKDGWIACTPSLCEVTVRGGPKWGPDVYVDVVVRLTDSAGQQYLLQAPNQHVKHSI